MMGHCLFKRGPYEHFDNEEIAQIDYPSRENRRHVHATHVDRAICKFLLCTRNLEIFSVNFSLKQNFENLQNFISLKISSPKVLFSKRQKPSTIPT